MEFLDIEGVKTLWNKIKEYIGTETKKYLPLNGGSMTGTIRYKTPNDTILCDVGTFGDVAHNQGSGRILCSVVDGPDILIQAGSIKVIKKLPYADSDTQPRGIEYSSDNIRITFRQNSTDHDYIFNLQKLIDDGYLIEE